MSAERRYLRPPWFMLAIMNPVMRLLVGTFGLGGKGRAVLLTKGRRSGQWRRTPVNVLDLNGNRYLVAPRGETDWVRNVRSHPEAQLVHGRRREEIRLTEVPNEEKAPILRAYLQRWGGEVRGMFDVPGANASDAQFAAIAANHPVFQIERAGG